MSRPAPRCAKPRLWDYIVAMLKKLFMRGKAAPQQEPVKPPPATSTVRTAAVLPATETATSPVEAAKPTHLESFKEQWEDKWEPHGQLPTPEVIEGNGGNTDWGMWTEAVKGEEDAFAPTEPMPLRPR